LWAGCPIRFEHSGHALSRWQTFQHAARLAKAKGAHDRVIGIIIDAQGNAVEIMAHAKRRLAEEYEAAQERGDVAKIGDNLPSVTKQNSKPTTADIGMSRKEIHEGRLIRDAEQIEPGIVRRTLDAAAGRAGGTVEAVAGSGPGGKCQSAPPQRAAPWRRRHLDGGEWLASERGDHQPTYPVVREQRLGR
jgi:hypothetical protein